MEGEGGTSDAFQIETSLGALEGRREGKRDVITSIRRRVVSVKPQPHGRGSGGGREHAGAGVTHGAGTAATQAVSLVRADHEAVDNLASCTPPWRNSR